MSQPKCRDLEFLAVRARFSAWVVLDRELW